MLKMSTPKSPRFFRLTTLTAVLTATLVAAPAMAALTGSIQISGVIPAATAIVVTGVTGYNNLDLTTTAADQSVATVKEINNTTNGYTVTLTSQNAGKLKNGNLGSVSYTAKYDNSTVNLSATPSLIVNSPASNTVVATTHNFKVSYTGTAAANLMVGTYSDTLTFTIAAN